MAPRRLKARLEELAASLPQGAMVRDPRHQRLKDIWCATHFGIGYERNVVPCGIWVNTEQDSDTDFVLRTERGDFPFQTTLADVPGRRMGDEHRPDPGASSRLLPYEPARGSIEGPDWIVAAICHKRAAGYSDASTLNLLVYANFATNGLDYKAIARKAAEPAPAFASVWVVTNHEICSVGPAASCGHLHALHLIYHPDEWQNL